MWYNVLPSQSIHSSLACEHANEECLIIFVFDYIALPSREMLQFYLRMKLDINQQIHF